MVQYKYNRYLNEIRVEKKYHWWVSQISGTQMFGSEKFVKNNTVTGQGEESWKRLRILWQFCPYWDLVYSRNDKHADLQLLTYSMQVPFDDRDALQGWTCVRWSLKNMTMPYHTVDSVGWTRAKVKVAAGNSLWWSHKIESRDVCTWYMHSTALELITTRLKWSQQIIYSYMFHRGPVQEALYNNIIE